MSGAQEIERTVDVIIEDGVRPFMEAELAGACEWAATEEGTERFVSELTGFVLDEEGVLRSTELSVSFVDPGRIGQLNAEFRGVDRPTDVLSFPCDDPDEVPEGETVFLGDIVVAPEVVLPQSREFGNTYESELSLLLTHGVLHLLGYDHIEDDEAEEMEARERAILAKRGIER